MAPGRGRTLLVRSFGTPDRRRPRLRAWAELLRVSALFSVPGDALAGATAAGLRPNRRTALAVGASLCLYEAGMALNDWADRDEDALDRPHRPLPSGRVTPRAALAASAALTATGLALAARAGRAPLAVASALAVAVWSYDLHLKHTPAAPATMAAARALDLLLGATATAGPAAPAPGQAVARAARVSGWAAARAARVALPSAAVLGAHTYAVTAVSRHEAHGGSTTAPLAALAATTALAALLARGARTRPRPPVPEGTGRMRTRPPEAGGASRTSARSAAGALAARAVRTPATRGVRALVPRKAPVPEEARLRREGRLRREVPVPQKVRVRREVPVPREVPDPAPSGRRAAGDGTAAVPWSADRGTAGRAAALAAVLGAAAYARTAGVPFLHAALHPSPHLTQRAVGGGIRAMIPLQAALAARGGALGAGLALMGLAPLARALARKVSPT
ncbi:SCO3242 family prenyltransferase [Streptomyces sp. NPDC045431]|uniref:SCO3242 family prenyltransferase n=1 Tax=Streptomyces sp. NPDC045431 TaxID=3155613 RepID=UPI00340ECD50